MSTSEPIVVHGSTPLVLVAPHGGRRDYGRRPWGSAPLKVNDLHTASLTEELAAATGAAAVINAHLDRNDVDLNRLSSVHDRVPAFLERLGDLVSDVLARHGHATVLMVHGWNVIQPAVDLGFGCAHGSPVDGTAAVSASFAATAVPSLVRALGRRGIAGTVGARYPARGRQNLVQLFTPRYRDDPRPLVRRLAALGPRADAVQLELGVPLRWPGGWRRRFIDACTEALPALLTPGEQSTPEPPTASQPTTQTWRQTLEIAGAGTSGLVALDAAGARLLLFPAEGGLVLFTGERTGGEAPGCVGGLRIEPTGRGALHVHFTGPMVRFPDTTPFLDLERGLGGADAVESAEVVLEFVPAHGEAAGPADFGAVRGAAVLDGERLSLDGLGFASAGAAPMVWPRVRAALDLGDGSRLSVTVGLADGSASGFLCRDGRHRPVAAAGARLGNGPDPLSEVRLDVWLDDGEHIQLCPRPVHHLPVVRGHGTTPLRLAYVCCSLGPGPDLAGWCEIGGV